MHGRIFADRVEIMRAAQPPRFAPHVEPPQDPWKWCRELDFVGLSNDDVIVASYDHASDSGVHVMRLHPPHGDIVWQTGIGGLVISHSTYDHRA